MIKRFTLLFVLLLSIPLLSKNEPEGISLTKTSDGYIVNFTLPDFQQTIIKAEGNDYILLDMPQYGTTSEVGLPSLPLVSFNLAIPDRSEKITVEVLSRNEETINLKERIYPYQMPWEKNSSLSDRPFVIDEKYYQTEGVKFSFASTSDYFNLGGVKGNIIVIHPFIYNPSEGKLTFIKSGSFRIKVDASGTIAANRSMFFDAFLSEVFVNYEGTSNKSSMKYLIITAPEFEAGLAPFVTHKTANGYAVDVFTTTVAGTTTTAVKTFIQNRYNNPLTKPDFVMLVGDVDKIPAWTGTGEGTPKTDLNYACVEGTDPYADVFLGRMSVVSNTQLANAINKIIYMSNNLAAFPKNNVFMASTDNYTISEGTHNYVIDNYFTPNSYNNLKLYSHSGATTAQVTAAFNAGKLFGIYSGHGGTTSWADGPVFTAANVTALTNTIYPFVYSFACITGDYSNTSECFGETWLRYPAGASAFYGSSVNSYWTEDDVLEKVLIKALFVDNLSKVTPMFNKAKVYFVNHFGSITPTVQRYLEMYNLMGDPSLETKRVIPPDTVAPLAIANLGLTTQTSNSITTNWTAPLDTTFGGITTYDIRYSTSPITSDILFNSAPQKLITNCSDSVGCVRSFCLDSLTPNTNYYIRIKAKDMWGNASPMSNQLSGMTWVAPSISVTPDSLRLLMNPDSTIAKTLTISNIRMEPSTLNYTVELANGIYPAFIKSASLSYIDESPKKETLKGILPEEGIQGYSVKGQGGPDAFGYKWIDSQEPNGPQYVWNDIAATGTLVPAWTATSTYTGTDEGKAGPFQIGFPFKYYGTPYTQIWFSSNGWLSFIDITNAAMTNATMPNVATPNGIIAPLWDDLDGKTTGKVYYKQEPGKFIVQYDNWPGYSSSTGPFTFQVVLYSSGKIMMYYKSVAGTLTSCSIGIENQAGTTGLLVAYNAAYLANLKAIQFSADPEWMIPNHYSGTLLSQSSASLNLNISTEGLEVGEYSMDVVIKSNSLEHSVKTIPVKLTVTNEIIADDSTFQLTVYIANGWNMVSIPGDYPNMWGNFVDNWWPGRNPLASVYKWTPGSGYTSITIATPTEAYWIHQSFAQTYNTCDEWPCSGIKKVPHNPIPVTTGWNMFGAYEDTVAVSGLTTTPPGLIVPGTVYGYNGTLYSATHLYPGYGYWILITAPGGIINMAKNNTALVKENRYENFGKIIITDASGKSFTLYSVNGEVNLDHYLLPPMPPEGCFDVRYSSGRIAENLSSYQGIDLSGVIYPVTVTAEKENFRIKDISGKKINTILKTGERLSINNISKLLVSSEAVPTEYSLSQNYPNPFNPTTQITYGIPKAGLVTLKVYNSIGEEAALLVNEVQEPGKYTLQFNSTGLASGVYLYKLTSGEFTQVKKMILLK